LRAHVRRGTALRDQSDAWRLAGLERPDGTPGPGLAVVAASRAVEVLALGVHMVRDPEPGAVLSRPADDRPAEGQPVGLGHLAAELDLTRVVDGDLAEPGEVIVAAVDDQACLLEVLVAADVEIEVHPSLDDPVLVTRGIPE